MKKYLVVTALLFCTLLVQAQRDRLFDENDETASKTKPTATLKTVSQEVDLPANGTVTIDSKTRDLEVLTWNQSKVKLVLTVIASKNWDSSKAEWEEIGVTVKQLGSRVSITNKAVGVNNFGLGYGYETYFNGNNEFTGTISMSGDDLAKVIQGAQNGGRATTIDRKSGSKAKARLTVYVPEKASLEIDNSYGNIYLGGVMNKLELDAKNCTIEAKNINSGRLKLKYAHLVMQDGTDLEVALENGDMKAKSIGTLDIDSKYSDVDIDKVDRIIMRSNNDEYNIEELGDLDGRKNYGSMRVEQLSKAFTLTGSNADVKIRRVSGSTETIKIDNKYADIRLPLRDVSNYQIFFEGAYSTIFAAFEKEEMKPEERPSWFVKKTNKSNENGPAVASSNWNSDCNYCPTDANSAFKASGGDTKGKTTKIEIRCPNCTVDFK
jgi:hypothetical protein